MNSKQLLALHKDTCAKCYDIMARKNNDYTGGEGATDALANFRSSEQFGTHPAIGLMLRMNDKLMRVKSFVADGKLRVSNESVFDACEDIINYAVLLKALLSEEMVAAVEPPADEQYEIEYPEPPAGFELFGATEDFDQILTYIEEHDPLLYAFIRSEDAVVGTVVVGSVELVAVPAESLLNQALKQYHDH